MAMHGVSRAVFAAVGMVAVTNAYPSFYGGGCFLSVGQSFMSATAANSAVCTISINGATMSHSSSMAYVPGQTYAVVVTGPTNRYHLFGSSAGSWTNGGGQSSLSGCGNGPGFLSNGYTGSSTATFTAPATVPATNGGTITIGATCGNFGALSTTVFSMTAPPTAAPTNPPPTAPPTNNPTLPPTASPTCAPGQQFQITQCVDINACLNHPCTISGQTCVDLIGQGDDAAGRTCTCPQGTAPSGQSCTEINACINNPCPTTAGTQCLDRPAPAPDTAAGRTCNCSTGYSSNSSFPDFCFDTNACLTGQPCVNRASDLPGGQIVDSGRCNDSTAPSTGFTCEPCPAGYEDSGAGNNHICVDIDYCAAGQPAVAACAAQGRSCIDNPPSASQNTSCANRPCENQTGTASINGAPCAACPDGSSPSLAQTACIPCGPGMAGSQGTCATCGVGTEPNSGSTACVGCQPGFIRGSTTAASCTQCPERTYSPNGVGPCVDCRAPGFAVNSARTSCNECPDPLVGVDGNCIACTQGLVRVNATTCAVPETTTGTTTTTTTTTQVLTPSNFCSMFMSTCGNGFGWNDANACQTSVTRYIDGTPGATSGNTLACRIYHLNVARQQIDGSPTESLHCSHASDSGNNTCVGAPSASDFCDDFIDTCGVNNGWVSAGECQAAVPAFITGSYPTDTTGNTLSCRAYHLGVAKSQAPATTGRANHCAHASSNGTDSNGGMPCAGSQVSVTNFCNDFISTCGGGNGWSDSAACVGEASTFVRGTLGDTTSFNTLECRIYHLTVAKRQSNSTLRATHCIHASRPGVTNVCDPIPSAADFCVTYLDVCTVSGSWSTQQGCVNGFSTVPRGFQGDTSGNSQGCRIYHLGAAMTNVAPGTAAHCSHASETGNNVCVDAPGSPVAPPVALTTTAAPTSPAPTVVGATLAPTAAPVVSGSSGNTAASAAGATSERSQHSKSSSTVAYVLTFLIGLLAYEYVLYLNAVQELVTPTSSITPKIALNDLSGTGTRSPTVTTPPLVFMQNA
eukprot:m.284809 g.284809  ORF g.284809 m.284809 type:complete len:1026 (+) comp16200_c1_seq1:304-3381(+)